MQEIMSFQIDKKTNEMCSKKMAAFYQRHGVFTFVKDMKDGSWAIFTEDEFIEKVDALQEQGVGITFFDTEKGPLIAFHVEETNIAHIISRDEENQIEVKE